jgi:LytR cell envelope-related transcriptional attenuator
MAVMAIRNPGTGSTRAAATTRTSTGHTSSPAPSPSPSSSVDATTTSSSAAASSTAKTSTSAAASTSAASGVNKADYPLIVLNDTSTTGLAQTAAQRFEAGTWTVTKTDNYTNDIISTAAYYDPSIAGAQAAATQLQTEFPAIKRVVPRFLELPAGPIVVVLTTDYS